MPVDTDFRIARRRLKRQLAVWRVVAITAIVAIIVVAVAPFAGVETGGYVARLSVEGVIVDDADRTQALREAAHNGAIEALIVHIDSPGGTAYGGEALFHDLRRIAGEKPVVAVMGTVATSAAYMTAIGSDRILARESTVTGSIGVVLQAANVQDLLDSIGVKPHTIKSSPLKAQPNPFEPFTPAAREVTEAVVDDMYRTFIDMVERRRDLPEDRKETLFDGRVFTGRQALEAGLIDAIGDEVDARQWLADTHGVPVSTPVREMQIGGPEEQVRDLLAEAVGKIVFPEWVTLDGIVSLWQGAR